MGSSIEPAMRRQTWKILFVAAVAVIGRSECSAETKKRSSSFSFPDTDAKLSSSDYIKGKGGLGGYSSRTGGYDQSFHGGGGYISGASSAGYSHGGLVGGGGGYGGQGIYGGYNGLGGQQFYGGGGYGGGYDPHLVSGAVLISQHGSDKKGSKGKFKGYKSKSKYKGKGYDYDYYDDSIVIKQPVIVQRPVVVQKPAVEYKTVVVKAPKPKYQPPILVHKPVIYKQKEWRLVDVPKVSYAPAYVQPVPGGDGYHKEKHKDKGKWWKSWSKGKGGSSWWR